MLPMGYQLTSESTGETLTLSPREWEMLLKLADQPAGWQPRGDREYTRGMFPAEAASEMAESVKVSLPYLSRERVGEQAGKARNVEELPKSLGYLQGDPHTFFGDAAGRRKVERFIKLASLGAFEVLPNPSEEEG
jgi:hypothetical protein